MIKRTRYIELLGKMLKRSRVVAILGPRQCGKTTLARQFSDGLPPENYFDLEDPVALSRLANPITELSDLKNLIVIDEIQRCPDLFPSIRVIADRNPQARFLILGSASPELLRQSSESLTGRIEYLEMSGFSFSELPGAKSERRWLRGGFPLSFLAFSEEDSMAWRRSFIRNFAERDLPQLGVKIPSISILRFWSMLAHYHGQIWNAAEMARSLNVSENTARHYLDLLTATFVVRQMPPWFENLKKRQVKSPKIYFRDTGILHSILGIGSFSALRNHPKLGFSWEGAVIEEILQRTPHEEFYFWRTHNGAELDLLLISNGRKIGFEVKREDAPKMTPSMKTALDDLSIDSITVVYPGNTAYSLHEKVKVIPFSQIQSAIG